MAQHEMTTNRLEAFSDAVWLVVLSAAHRPRAPGSRQSATGGISCPSTTQECFLCRTLFPFRSSGVCFGVRFVLHLRADSGNVLPSRESAGFCFARVIV